MLQGNLFSDAGEVTVLSYGMGVESTAILLRWIYEPATRPCALEDLIVITSQVGDEYADTGRDVDAHVVPLLRKHGIRWVQVARAGHHEADGITVLEDSRNPSRTFLEGDYKLSDELGANGTIPQSGGEHRCALKFKAFVIDRWLGLNTAGEIRHAFGYNADETKRVEKSEIAIAFGFNVDEPARAARSKKYDGPRRRGLYPLLEWKWTRQDCIAYIQAVTGIVWRKSACVFCPFNRLDECARDRHQEHPAQVADAMKLEHTSLAMNPRGLLYKTKSLIQITTDAPAVAAYQQWLESSEWALYRVRRVYSGPGKADRCVERLEIGTRQEAETRLAAIGATVEQRGIPYAYVSEREADVYPAREEYYTIAPAVVATKARYSVEWFNNRYGA